MNDILCAYLPQDRYRALLKGENLPERSQGSALFADISGFTALTEKLSLGLGARRGIEELTHVINAVYRPLIAEIERFGGSVINFAGDSVTCWFDNHDGPAGPRTAACAQAMQQIMKSFENLTLKIAITSGEVHRLVVGNPEIHLIDTLAGATVVRLASGEHLAKLGEVLLDEGTVQGLGESITTKEWQTTDSGERFAVLASLSPPFDPPEYETPTGKISDEVLKRWILPVVFEREQSGLGVFLTELRPAVALFLRFSGIDYDVDETAGQKLDVFIRRVQDIMRRFEGNLIQLTIGDKGSYLYASFGVPITHEDDAQRAAQAAWAVSRLPQELGYLEPLQIGISKGTMRSGAYGGPTRLTFGALGDDTNLAARLMTSAVPGEILVSRRVYKLISDRFNCEPRPPLPMKGKAEPVPVFSITGLRRHRPVRLEEPTYTLPMIGRRAELDIIHQKLDLTLQGHGQVIGIMAEAGMGKSRLVAEAVRLAYRSGFTGYGGNCEASGMNTAYLVWRPIWQAFFNIDLASSPRRQQRNLEVEIEDRAPSHIQAAPVLSSLLEIPIEENEFTRTLEPKDRRNVLTAILEDCLKSAVHEEPLLLVLEDIHWIDPLSHDLLESLARVCMNLSVCFLVTLRPPDAVRLQKERVEALAHFTRLELAPLNEAESEQMIRTKLMQLYPEQFTSLPESLVNLLTSRAEGNPFYMEELLNFLHDRGLNPYTVNHQQSFDLPSSLHALILSRIDQLTEAQKITLKIASIIGRLFQVSWLDGYYPSLSQEAQLKTNLAELARINLTVLETPEPELTYLFKHILTRDVVYESLAYITRVQLHEQLAQFLETLGEERFLDLIAYHYGLTENFNKQKEYFQKAGDAAKAAYANEAAMEYYERLKPLLTDAEPRMGLHLKRGEILELIGRWTEAETEYRSALELSVQTGAMGTTIRSQEAMGTIFLSRGDFPAALEWLELARKGAQEAGDWLVQAQVLRAIGNVNEKIGNQFSAQEYYRASLKLAKENEDQKMEAQVLGSLSSVYTEMGEYTTAHEITENGLRLMNAIGDKQGISIALNRLGLLANYLGHKTTAMDYYNKSLSISREIGDKWAVSATLNNLAVVASSNMEANRLVNESLTIARELGDQWSEGRLLINLGVQAVEVNNYGPAQAYFEEGLAILRELGDKPGCAFALLNLGYLACEQKEFTRARPWIQESLKLFQEVDSKWGIIYNLVGLSAISAGQNRFQPAVVLAGAVEAMRESIHLALEKDGTRLYEQAISAARKALNTLDFEAAWESGRQLSIEEVMSLALSAS